MDKSISKLLVDFIKHNPASEELSEVEKEIINYLTTKNIESDEENSEVELLEIMKLLNLSPEELDPALTGDAHPPFDQPEIL